eukprot:TRINITY_DN74875_c0_g1_i1.p1 TRINITY_DN74875_c0_g1~~TRINITY_DN74875_c0_g1_i1.p1  ORF type:complete len:245 (+),score=32.49 TRINITY_DN74875_c0_g1_i1:70-804(+)
MAPSKRAPALSLLAFLAGGALLLLCPAGEEGDANAGRQLEEMDVGQARNLKMLRALRILRMFTDEGGMIGMVVRLLVYGLYVICGLFFARQYKTMVVDKVRALPDKSAGMAADFANGLFGCCGNTQLCLHSCFCFSCRAAHTWQVTGVVGYWAGLFGLCFCSPFMCCISGYFRSQLRKKLGFAPGGVCDFLVWIPCFGCCAVGQEALQVDASTGVQVACCCRLQQLSGQDNAVTVVGAPVAVQG